MDIDKLNKWAELLLDTGKRNNLINFKDAKMGTVEIVSPDFDTLFSKAEHSATFEVYDPKLDDEEDDEESSLLSLYQKNKFEFLVELAFVKEKELSISLTFLQYIARTFLQAIANDPKFNFSKTPYDCEVDDKTICNIIENTPYIIGLEFVNKEWVLNILGKFNTAYKNVVQKSEKTPFEYILSKGNLFTVPSRIYFHLVENKDNDGYPFAFLATYTAIGNGKLIHCPLKNALTQ